jgi:predicted permease
MDPFAVFYQMLILFLLILIGFLCSRTGLVNEDNAKSISGLIVHIFNPALIFSSVLSNSEKSGAAYTGLITLIAVCMFAFLIVIGSFTSKLFAKEHDENSIYRLMTVFSNLGFIGIPLVNSLYGSSALIYVAIFILIYNILLYTYGISILEKRKNLFSKAAMKQFLNAGTLSCCLTLLVFCFHLPVHPILKTSVIYLGNAAIPLALMSIGISLGQSDLRSILTDKKLYLFSFMKLLVIPAAGVFILKFLPIPTQVLGVCAIMLAMPIGNMPVMLANQYGINGASCSRGIVITTLFSVVTLPLIVSML